jgi:hypothetical protein
MTCSILKNSEQNVHTTLRWSSFTEGAVWMEILLSIITLPAMFAGVVLLALLARGIGTLEGPATSFRLIKKALLYTILLIFLFISYTFALSAALATSYIYFIVVFTSLFGCSSFLFPTLIVRLFGRRIQWFARSVAAFGFAFVILTFSALLIRLVPLSATIPKSAILLIAFVSVSLFALPRLLRIHNLER